MSTFLQILIAITSTQTAQPLIITTSDIEIEFTARSPNQMGSFYEARGFPKSMLNILKQHCYITAGITNLSNQKIWLDLSQWQFSSAGEIIKREHRDHWKQRWQSMGIPLSQQSTFRWTLIPESLDYLPGEHEGGNLVLPFTNKPITLKATFATGEDKQGKEIVIFTNKLFCAEDAE